MKIFAFSTLVSVLLFNPAMAQQSNDPVDRAAANRALGTLRALVNQQDPRDYGFNSRNEAESASLGLPIQVSFVRLDELREYSEDQDPASLLNAGHQVFVPVTVGGQVRSSILLEQSGEEWRPVSFGSPNLARLLDETRAAAARGSNVDEASISAVHVAALGRYYIVSRSDDRLMLTAVTNDPELQIKVGESRPANELFAQLAPIAQAYNELPTS